MTYTLIWHCAILVSFIDSLYTVMQDRRLCWISSADLTSTWYCSHVGSVRKPPCWWSNFLHIGVQSMPRWPCTMADCQRCTCCGAEHSATIHITTNAEHALIIGEHRLAALFQPAAGERKSEKNLKLCTCASFCAAPRQMTGQLLHRFSWCTLPLRAINDAALVDGATGTRHGSPQTVPGRWRNPRSIPRVGHPVRNTDARPELRIRMQMYVSDLRSGLWTYANIYAFWSRVSECKV